MRAIHIFLSLFAALNCPTVALADSDGYFCIGPDYLAFELSFSRAPHTHRLYVMRFDDPIQWKAPVWIDLPEFNNGPMRCEERSIALAAWESIHHVTWSVADPADLSLQTTTKPPGPSDPSDYPDALGSLSFGIPGNTQEYSASLPSHDLDYSYTLSVTRTRDLSKQCVVHVRSTVAQQVADAVVDEYELFAGTMPAECGE